MYKELDSYKQKEIEKSLEKIRLGAWIAGISAGGLIFFTDNVLFVLSGSIGILVICVLQMRLYIKYSVAYNYIKLKGWKLESGLYAFVMFLICVVFVVLIIFAWIDYGLYGSL